MESVRKVNRHGKPKYLYITPFFPSPESWRGGFCLDAAKALMRDGRFDVIVLKPEAGPDYSYDGVNVFRFPILSPPSGILPFLFAGHNSSSFIKKLNKIGIHPCDVAVCHAHIPTCAPFAIAIKKANPKVVALWQSHQMGAPFNLRSGSLGTIPVHTDLLYLFYKALFERMDAIVLLSHLHERQFGMSFPHGPLGNGIDMRKECVFGRFFNKIQPKQTIVLYNGIDRSVFNPSGRKSHTGFRIGCIANFGKTKGQMTLLKAIELLINGKCDHNHQELALEFVGSGETLAECKQFVTDHNLENIVEFKSEVDHLNLPEVYKSYDLFVLPTLQEGFCCTLVEAAGCGTPIMSCRGTSIEEVIPEEDKGKWLCDPLDYRGLASLIEKYIKNRWHFRFSQSLDIDLLWGKFLTQVEALR